MLEGFVKTSGARPPGKALEEQTDTVDLEVRPQYGYTANGSNERE
jgi:hypothetical protein